METKERMTVGVFTKILVPAATYNLKADKRLLIPFTSGDKIGFVNNEGEIVAKPIYSTYYGDCYGPNDLIKVAIDDYTHYERAGGKAVYYNYPLYGLINHQGKVVLDIKYRHIIRAIGNNNLLTVEVNNKWGVIDTEGNEIVPFGKYDLIDGFDKGFARVKIGKAANYIADGQNKWGIINENGVEVLPVEYDNIWKFYGKPYRSIVVRRDGKSSYLPFSELEAMDESTYIAEDYGLDDDYGTNYGEFTGSYAQDEMGYSDDVINDAFDGEPDAYWNID